MTEFSDNLLVPRQHPSYAGHFPGNPVVPGALLLLWLQRSMESAFPDWQWREVSSVKFQAEVRPGDQLQVSARLLADAGSLSVLVQRDSRPVCKLRCKLARPGAA